MVLLAWQGWAWLSWLGGGIILPLLKKIPWQVWAGIAIIIAVLYYGHVREQRGYERCQAQVKEATDREVARQSQVAKEAIEASKRREAEAEAKVDQATEDLKGVQGELNKLKQAGTTVCLPSSVTGKYRNRQ